MGTDKILHFLVSFLLSLYDPLFSLLAGIGKELFDVLRGSGAEFWDLVADWLGILVGRAF